MNRKTIVIFLSFAIAMLSGILAQAKTFPLTSSPSNPAASGKVDVKKDKNGNTEVMIKTEHMAKPGMLTPPASKYVIWFQERDQDPANQGELKVEKSLKAEFKTTTHLQNFDVFVTAESDPLTKSPAGQTVLRTKVQEVD
jgi:hypothetical protein